MKKLAAVLLATFALALPCAAIPLTVLIEQEGEKLEREIATWKKECANHVDTSSDSYQVSCWDSRAAIGGKLAKFVWMIHDEIDGFLDTPGARETYDGGRRLGHMQLLTKWALYEIQCLGRESASECRAEKVDRPR